MYTHSRQLTENLLDLENKMRLTESQLRKLIRLIIRESVSDEHHSGDEDHSSEDEEPIGDEGKLKTVITIAKEVKGLMA